MSQKVTMCHFWGGGAAIWMGHVAGGGCSRVLAMFHPFLDLGSHHTGFTFYLFVQLHIYVLLAYFVFYFTIKKSLKSVVSEVPLACLYQGMFPPCCFW